MRRQERKAATRTLRLTKHPLPFLPQHRNADAWRLSWRRRRRQAETEKCGVSGVLCAAREAVVFAATHKRVIPPFFWRLVPVPISVRRCPPAKAMGGPRCRVMRTSLENKETHHTEPTFCTALQLSLAHARAARPHSRNMACVRCPVCLAGDGADSWSVVVSCGHVLHTDCLAQCLRANSKCPCCRVSVWRCFACACMFGK